MSGIRMKAGAARRAPTEAQASRSPDATAGLALLRARLARYSKAEQEAFWKAVRLCFAAPQPEVDAA